MEQATAIALSDDERALTEEEAAKVLRIPQRTLGRLRKEGKGPPHYRVGIRIRYSLRALREWEDEGGTKGGRYV